ncbi:RlpA-like double-psi beta-barrel-protein domain-containing protein-containing protein [Flagelloscypha sp. PMI_526]|nr:RlpA-like double-psi beta-barrel-protein domain-containing protein-containing protein [Flagelloscypha sp. PMI_526]
MFSPFVTLVALVAPFAIAGPHHSNHVRHHDIAQRMENSTSTLNKRFSGSRWTFYDAGLGACGKTNSRDDFIVALNSAQYGGGYPGPQCFKKIKMTYKGKTATATIMDECPGCPFGGLDLTEGLFEFFDNKDKGVLSGEWSFSDGGDDGGDDDDEPKTTPKKEEPKTTSSKKDEPKTSSSEKETSTSTSHSTTSHSSTSTSTHSSSSTVVSASAASASGAASTATAGVVDSMNQAILKMSQFAIAGYQA